LHPQFTFPLNKINIAIDGYSSCGKSTLAKALASELGYNYVDSGAMYRAITLFALNNDLISESGELKSHELIERLHDIHLSFHYNHNRKASDIYLGGENIEERIRMMDVSELVSKVSQIKEVRDVMVSLQKRMGRNKGVVMDGRDIGTAVFPDAELKIFMTADPETRVYRRYDELTAKGIKVTVDEIKDNLFQRDYDDTNRKDNPLTKAHDAIVLDNTDLDKRQQLDFVIRLVNDLQLIKD
jgi:CMP/dCMP kinase